MCPRSCGCPCLRTSQRHPALLPSTQPGIAPTHTPPLMPAVGGGIAAESPPVGAPSLSMPVSALCYLSGKLRKKSPKLLPGKEVALLATAMPLHNTLRSLQDACDDE